MIEPLAAVLLVLGTLAVLWVVLLVVLLLHRPSRELVRPALRLIPDLIRLVRGLLTDRSVERRIRFVLVLLLAWLVSPIDLLPEFLPAIGGIDDVIVAALVLRWVARRMGTDALRSRWTGSDASFALLCRLIRAPVAGGP